MSIPGAARVVVPGYRTFTVSRKSLHASFYCYRISHVPRILDDAPNGIALQIIDCGLRLSTMLGHSQTVLANQVEAEVRTQLSQCNRT